MTENTYHAVVKMHKDDSPKRIIYTAAAVGPAIVHMAKLCKVASTADIYEFEILEVVGRDSYKRVAMKLPTAVKPHISAAAIDPPVTNLEEVAYIPYKLKVA